MQNFLPRLLKWLGLVAAALVVIAIGAVAVYLVTITRGLPSVEALQDYTPPITTRVYAGNGTVLGEYARERRIFVPATFIPKLVKQAFTSAEDRNFYSHPGIDPSGIVRAAIKASLLVSSSCCRNRSFTSRNSARCVVNFSASFLASAKANLLA